MTPIDSLKSLTPKLRRKLRELHITSAEQLYCRLEGKAGWVFASNLGVSIPHLYDVTIELEKLFPNGCSGCLRDPQKGARHPDER